MWRREPSNSGRQPATDSALGRFSAKSRPARCSAASASPTGAQCWTRDAARPQAVQEGRDGGGLAGQRAQRVAVAAVDRRGAGDAVRRQMLHQAEEERQILRVDALLVERQDVLAARRGQQVVGVLDALGDALEGDRLRRCRSRRGRPRARRRRLRCRPPSRHHLRHQRARQLEHDAFLGRAHFLDRDVEALAAGGDQLVDQQSRAPRRRR